MTSEHCEPICLQHECRQAQTDVPPQQKIWKLQESKSSADKKNRMNKLESLKTDRETKLVALKILS